MTTQEIVTHAIGAASAETMLLADELRTVEPGGTISYIALNRTCGMDTQHEARGRLHTARNIVLREDSIVFDVVRGVGLKRSTDHDLALQGHAALKSVNRATGRSIKKARCIEHPEQLPMQEQNRFFTSLTMLTVMHDISKGRSLKKIETYMGASPRELEQQAVYTLLATAQPQ